MILGVFCIRDGALGAYTRPFFVPSKGIAIRAFTDEVNNPQSDFFKHPTDYELYHLGDWDDQFARFDLLPQPVSVVRAQDVMSVGADPAPIRQVK